MIKEKNIVNVVNVVNKYYKMKKFYECIDYSSTIILPIIVIGISKVFYPESPLMNVINGVMLFVFRETVENIYKIKTGDKLKINNLINKKSINILNEKNKNLILKLRNKESLNEEEQINVFSVLYFGELIKKMSNKLNDDVEIINTICKENNIDYEKGHNIIMKYQSLEIKNVNKNILLYNADTSNTNNIQILFKSLKVCDEKTNYIMKYKYEFKKNDYEDLINLICLTHRIEKISYDSETRQFNLIKKILENPNIKADWKYIKNKVISSYPKENNVYKNILCLLDLRINDKSEITFYSDSIDVLKIKKINLNFTEKQFLNINLNYHNDLYSDLNKKYNYLKENNFTKEVELILGDALPLIESYNNKIKELKSEKVIESSVNSLKTILVELNKELDKLVENMEYDKVKDIKIEAKYQKMKI